MAIRCLKIEYTKPVPEKPSKGLVEGDALLSSDYSLQVPTSTLLFDFLCRIHWVNVPAPALL